MCCDGCRLCGRRFVEPTDGERSRERQLRGTRQPVHLGLGSFAYKVEPPVSGTYSLDGISSVTIVVTEDGLAFDWTSTLGIDAVIVKGGPNATVYTYDPESYGDLSLTAPYNSSSGSTYGLSHIEFCFDYEVVVAKTANTSYDRNYSWSIDKTSTVTELLLSEGQQYTVPYEVTVSVASAVDSNFAVAGSVTVSNPAPFAATIESISDVLGSTSVALDCGAITFPYELAAAGTLTCTYDVAVATGTNVTNTVTVTTSGCVGGGTDSAVADFSKATVTSYDECVDVTDDRYGALGTTCAPGPKTYSYSILIGPFACGESTYVNTASFLTNDTAATGSDSWSIPITVECDVGCTLTPGYWKTHSALGPAPYDDTWAMLPDAHDTPFYLSGTTYYHVLWTPPQGNVYYILAHAFIAAQLNQLNGASFESIASTWNAAATAFATYTPAYLAQKTKPVMEIRSYLLGLATALDDYNNGITGPGHCSE